MFSILFVTVVVMLATLLACVWPANRKHARRQVRQWLASLRALAVWIMFGVEVALGFATEVRARFRHRGFRFGTAANVYTGQDKTHEETISRIPDAAITLRHLLYKKGAGVNTAGVLNSSIAVIAAQTDVPLFAVADQWETPTAFAATDVGQPVACIMLGVSKSTVRMLANAAGLVVGDIVYAVAGGYVDKKSNLTASSTAYAVGVIIDVPGQVSSSAQGDVLEVASDVAALTST